MKEKRKGSYLKHLELLAKIITAFWFHISENTIFLKYIYLFFFYNNILILLVLYFYHGYVVIWNTHSYGKFCGYLIKQSKSWWKRAKMGTNFCYGYSIKIIMFVVIKVFSHLIRLALWVLLFYWTYLKAMLSATPSCLFLPLHKKSKWETKPSSIFPNLPVHRNGTPTIVFNSIGAGVKIVWIAVRLTRAQFMVVA